LTPSNTPQSITVAPVKESEIGPLLRMIRHEAEYEKLTEGFAASEAKLYAALFGPKPVAEVLIARAGDEPVGFCVFFTTFSTFSGQTGLYMEDLFVEEKVRGEGVGGKLVQHLAQIALERHCHGINWSVLKWNASAIRFYRGIGAQPLEAWDHFALAGDALEALARQAM
jgi:GNAT superfamily N-acetyltransferase